MLHYQVVLSAKLKDKKHKMEITFFVQLVIFIASVSKDDPYISQFWMGVTDIGLVTAPMRISHPSVPSVNNSCKATCRPT